MAFLLPVEIAYLGKRGRNVPASFSSPFTFPSPKFPIYFLRKAFTDILQLIAQTGVFIGPF